MIPPVDGGPGNPAALRRRTGIEGRRRTRSMHEVTRPTRHVDVRTTRGGYSAAAHSQHPPDPRSTPPDVTAGPRSSPRFWAHPGRMAPTSSRLCGEEGPSAMIPGQFDYVRPADLTETLRILKDREGEAKLLSGGYSLLPLIKLRLAQPALLVDLRDVSGLDGIAETDDQLSIGARATHRQDPRGAGHSRPLPAPPRRDRHHRRSAGAQLGHDRWLGGARRPGLGLAGRPARDQRDHRLPQPGRASARSPPGTSSSTPSPRPSSRPRS